MMTIDEFEEAMDQIAEELPEEFYRELNGGILILPEKRKSPYAKADDLWVLGMYVHSSSMGRLIEIYYGSFCEVMKGRSREAWIEQMRETLYHEFTHHMESLAGEKMLEEKDCLLYTSFTKSGTKFEGNADQILLPEKWDLKWVKEIRKVGF